MSFNVSVLRENTMVTRLLRLAVALIATALLPGAALAADAQQAEHPSHRARPAISAPVSPAQQEAAKKANAEYKAAKQKARADYRKALADAKAAHDQALAGAKGSEKRK
jgi:hypothetical protein